MYTATFYSFKGGVGRSMALANVGTQLAQTGQRVLIVDFDLEAPGLDVLQFDGSHPETPGIVDYVHDYLRRDSSPDLRHYIRKIEGIGRNGGELWLMPAGRDDDSYAERLAAIDWFDLYENHDGYVMFEDLKAQWSELLQPDYVLIDSRTGHTDVGGICTRQLPDEVVILFMPNEQSLRGLTRIVRDVRAEAAPPRQRRIRLQFVMSNVPDLDDEEEILDKQLRKYQRELNIERRPAVIHRYDSLALLKQTIFTKDRPRSRLAKEYRALARSIRENNPQDALGADRFLRIVTALGDRFPRRELEERLKSIRANHGKNATILFRIGVIRQRQGEFQEALALFDEAAFLGHHSAELYASLAYCRLILGDKAGAVTAARSAFDQPEARLSALNRALQVLRDGAPATISDLSSTRAVRSLGAEDRARFAGSLAQSATELVEARRIFEELVAQAGDRRDVEAVKTDFSLVLIGLGDFAAAARLIASAPNEIGSQIVDTFNYAMASWGETRQVPRQLMERVVTLASDPSDGDANFYQCLALANWAIGATDSAKELVRVAEREVRRSTRAEFSCWRYLRVSPEEFRKDLHTLCGLIEGNNVLPEVLRTTPLELAVANNTLNKELPRG